LADILSIMLNYSISNCALYLIRLECCITYLLISPAFSARHKLLNYNSCKIVLPNKETLNFAQTGFVWHLKFATISGIQEHF